MSSSPSHSLTRRKFFVGNWKMNKTLGEAERDYLSFSELVAEFAQAAAQGSAQDAASAPEFALAVPHIALPALSARAMHGLATRGGGAGCAVGVYAQSCHFAAAGAYTGDISAPMLADLGVHGSLVAHSERRQYAHESSADSGRRVCALLRRGLDAIYCVGETLVERRAGRLVEVLREQMTSALRQNFELTAADVLGVDPTRTRLTVAYEPVWAIGTGLSATPAEAAEAHGLLRGLLAELFSPEVAARTRLLYGGSVTETNVAGFVHARDVDGVLVGGASLEPRKFFALCRKALQ